MNLKARIEKLEAMKPAQTQALTRLERAKKIVFLLEVKRVKSKLSDYDANQLEYFRAIIKKEQGEI